MAMTSCCAIHPYFVPGCLGCQIGSQGQQQVGYYDYLNDRMVQQAASQQQFLTASNGIGCITVGQETRPFFGDSSKPKLNKKLLLLGR